MKVPVALPVDEPLPVWEDVTEVVPSPLDLAVLKTLTGQDVSLVSVILGLVCIAIVWYRKTRNRPQ